MAVSKLTSAYVRRLSIDSPRCDVSYFLVILFKTATYFVFFPLTLGDMSISDLFGLGLPRGSLLGSQSTTASPGCRNYQYQGRNQGSSQHYQVTFPFIFYIMPKILPTAWDISVSYRSSNFAIYVILIRDNYPFSNS